MMGAIENPVTIGEWHAALDDQPSQITEFVEGMRAASRGITTDKE